MYSNENDLLDLRLKYLDKYVDYFVIIESCFNHKGEKRKLLFNHKKYKRFKNKIIYLIYKKTKNLKKINKNASQIQKALIASNNAWLRENGQRNFIESGLNNAAPNDIILISDVDEIPNLENVNFNKITNKLIFFRQKWFYYKLNLKLPNYTEIGTRACKKKNLISPQWLRNIKRKKYPNFRIDTLFSKVKYTNIKMIKNGGWHFTYLKKAKDIYSEKEIKKKLPFFQSDPESEYSSFLEHDRIPSVVMFELTYNCNEMCVHCFNPGAARNEDEKSLRNKRVEIDIEHYSSLLKDLDNMGVYKIILTGGDPFVKPKIWQLIEMISKTNIVVDIYTNGLALLGRVERLANHWPLSIGLSIYSGDDNVHNSITRVPNSLKKSLIVVPIAIKNGL